MFTLKASIREISGKKVKRLRAQGVVPAVLYGPKLKKPALLQVGLKEFENVFRDAGETSLLLLQIGRNEARVLIHGVEKDYLTSRPIHIDFYQPSLEQKIEAAVPLVFAGEVPAVKEFNGTLVKSISEVQVRALPQDLPKEIRADVSKLKTFEDEILIGDLEAPPGVDILRSPDEVVAVVVPPEKVELELEKPFEEKVEEVARVEREKEEEPPAE